MGLKPSCDFFNPVTQISESHEHQDNIKIVDDVGGGAATALGVRKKVVSLLELCRQNGITLNPDKFCISRKIELRGFEISSSEENPIPMIRPTKLAVNKLLDYKEPQDKKSVQ